MYYPSYRNDPPRVMTVIGTARLFRKPDMVTIQLEVLTENKQLQQAHQENTLKMNHVIQALLQSGILKENIQTSSFIIHPRYDYVDGKQVFMGYQVINSIIVKMKNLEQAGPIMDAAVKNGVNQISDIQFTLENQPIYYQKALSDALKNALAKAQTIAETLKVKFDHTPMKIIEEIGELPHPLQKFAVVGNSISTPIEPGEIEIRAKVEVQIEFFG